MRAGEDQVEQSQTAHGYFFVVPHQSAAEEGSDCSDVVVQQEEFSARSQAEQYFQQL